MRRRALVRTARSATRRRLCAALCSAALLYSSWLSCLPALPLRVRYVGCRATRSCGEFGRLCCAGERREPDCRLWSAAVLRDRPRCVSCHAHYALCEARACGREQCSRQSVPKTLGPRTPLEFCLLFLLTRLPLAAALRSISTEHW